MVNNYKPQHIPVKNWIRRDVEEHSIFTAKDEVGLRWVIVVGVEEATVVDPQGRLHDVDMFADFTGIALVDVVWEDFNDYAANHS